MAVNDRCSDSDTQRFEINSCSTAPHARKAPDNPSCVDNNNNTDNNDNSNHFAMQIGVIHATAQSFGKPITSAQAALGQKKRPSHAPQLNNIPPNTAVRILPPKGFTCMWQHLPKRRTWHGNIIKITKVIPA